MTPFLVRMLPQEGVRTRGWELLGSGATQVASFGADVLRPPFAGTKLKTGSSLVSEWTAGLRERAHVHVPCLIWSDGCGFKFRSALLRLSAGCEESQANRHGGDVRPATITCHVIWLARGPFAVNRAVLESVSDLVPGFD